MTNNYDDRIAKLAALRAADRASLNRLLFEMAGNAHLPAIDAFLKAGADLDAKGHEGLTVLHYAAITGQAAAMEALVARGAAINAADNRGRTALHYAAMSEHIAAMEALIAMGAAADARDHRGRTPLHATI